MFKGSVRTPSLKKAAKAGLLNVQVIATDRKSANFGMAKATYKIAHP